MHRVKYQTVSALPIDVERRTMRRFDVMMGWLTAVTGFNDPTAVFLCDDTWLEMLRDHVALPPASTWCAVAGLCVPPSTTPISAHRIVQWLTHFFEADALHANSHFAKLLLLLDLSVAVTIVQQCFLVQLRSGGLLSALYHAARSRPESYLPGAVHAQHTLLKTLLALPGAISIQETVMLERDWDMYSYMSQSTEAAVRSIEDTDDEDMQQQQQQQVLLMQRQYGLYRL